MRPILTVCLIAASALTLACRSPERRAAPSSETTAATKTTPTRRVDFTLTKAYANQRRSDVAPFHEPGGDWTFFDCALARDPSLSFSLGFGAAPPRGTLGFTTTVIVDTGGRLLEELARLSDDHGVAAAKLHVGVGTTLFGEDAAVPWAGHGSGTSYVAELSFEHDRDALFLHVDPKKNEGTFLSNDGEKAAAFLAALRAGVDAGAPPAVPPASR